MKEQNFQLDMVSGVVEKHLIGLRQKIHCFQQNVDLIQ